MTTDAPLIEWLAGVRNGDPAAAEHLWNRYFHRLTELASHKLPGHRQRGFDGEDVALSAFRSFVEAARNGRYPDLNDPHDLWKVLVVITARKAASYLRREGAAKRGGGEVRGESGFGSAAVAGEQAGIDGIIAQEPTPAFACEFVDQYQRLLGALDDPTLREIAVLKMEGFTVAEIAGRLGTAQRTVERRLNMIRVRFLEVGDGNSGDD